MNYGPLKFTTFLHTHGPTPKHMNSFFAATNVRMTKEEEEEVYRPKPHNTSRNSIVSNYNQ